MGINAWLDVIRSVFEGLVSWDELPEAWKAEIFLVIEHLQFNQDLKGDLVFPISVGV